MSFCPCECLAKYFRKKKKKVKNIEAEEEDLMNFQE